MADDEKEGEPSSSRGAEWEVVQLTASTYAAAPPGADELEPTKEGELDKNVHGSSSAMFMPDHFVFPPAEHENLPIVTGYDDDIQGLNQAAEEGGGADEAISPGVADEDEWQEPTLTGIDESFCDSSDHGDPSERNLDSPTKNTEVDENEYGGAGAPGESWWKRRALCLYRNTKDASTFWSIFVAAALMGLVVLGKRWQQEKWHLQQLKWHINDERLSRMMGPIGRLKDVLIGSHLRNPLIRGSSPPGC